MIRISILRLGSWLQLTSLYSSRNKLLNDCCLAGFLYDTNCEPSSSEKLKYFINFIQVTFLAKQNCPATKQGHFSCFSGSGLLLWEAVSKTSLWSWFQMKNRSHDVWYQSFGNDDATCCSLPKSQGYSLKVADDFTNSVWLPLRLLLIFPDKLCVCVSVLVFEC